MISHDGHDSDWIGEWKLQCPIPGVSRTQFLIIHNCSAFRQAYPKVLQHWHVLVDGNRVSMEEVGQQLSILHDSVEDAVQGGALRLEISPEKDASNWDY